MFLKTEIDTTSPYQGLVTKILMVFSEFEREMTSRRATDQIKARYQCRFPRLKRISPNTIYRVLTNKAYLGIRAIHKRDKASYEEVSAAWEPILEEKPFGQVQTILQANKHRYHRRGPQRYTYLLSGLLRCGKCGEKLQGKSAHSSNGERFRELQAQGRERLGRQIGELRQSLKGLESEGVALKKQVEVRIQELTRTKAEAVRDSIEKSIVDLGQKQKELEEKRLFANHAVHEVESVVQNDGDLFGAYSRQIRTVLDGPSEGLKAGLQGLIASLLLTDTEIKLALSGVPLREPVRLRLVSSPQVAQHTTGRPGLTALIEGSIPLPGLTQLRSKSYLAQLYHGRHLSARQIARLTKTNRSVVLAALRKCGISKNGHNRTHPGQLPFGYDYQNYRLVKNQAEQGVIRLIRQDRAGGLSLRQIVSQLNEHSVPSKSGGAWQANTVRLILAGA